VFKHFTSVKEWFYLKIDAKIILLPDHAELSFTPAKGVFLHFSDPSFIRHFPVTCRESSSKNIRQFVLKAPNLLKPKGFALFLTK